MSSTSKNRRPREVPAAHGGPSTVPPPPGATVEWRETTHASVPIFHRSPQPGHAVYVPTCPKHGVRGVELEEFFARSVSGARQAGRPKVFAAPNRWAALSFAYRAMLDLRYIVEGRPRPSVSKAAASAWSSPDTFTALLKLGVKPVLARVRIDSGCTTVSALEEAAGDDTAFVVASSVFGNTPDVDAISQLCSERKLGFLLDATHGPYRWKGRRPPDLMVVGAREPRGAQTGLIVAWDPALVEVLEGFGWLSAPFVEVPSAAEEKRRVRVLSELYEGLAERPKSPWQPLSKKPPPGGASYGAALVFDAAGPVWRAKLVGPTAARRLLAEELTARVSNGFPPPCSPEGEVLDGVEDLLQSLPLSNAASLAERVHVVDLSRDGAAGDVLRAIDKLVAWVTR